MNVSVMQENLARGLGVVSRAVSSRATLPVHSANDEGSTHPVSAVLPPSSDVTYSTT